MTEGVKPLEPSQPTLLTQDVELVMPSRYYAAIKFFPVSKEEKEKTDQHVSANEGTGNSDNSSEEFEESPSFDSGSGPDGDSRDFSWCFSRSRSSPVNLQSTAAG